MTHGIVIHGYLSFKTMRQIEQMVADKCSITSTSLLHFSQNMTKITSDLVLLGQFLTYNVVL